MKYLIFSLLILSSELASAQKLPFNFEARGILTLSDADMLASAYADGKLGTEIGIQDQLSLIQWNKKLESIQTLEIPNSVTNWVNALDISADGKTAFVVDTRGSLPRSVQQVQNVFTDLPPANNLYAIDIQDLNKPKMIAKIEVGISPLSVSVNPKDATLLICSAEKGKEIVLVEWKNGNFGQKKTFAQDHKISHANWHPSGNYLGITLENTQQIAFFSYEKLQIKPCGKPMSIAGFLGAGLFSPNGKFYVVPNLNWDKGYNQKGELIVIQFAPKGNHTISGKTEVGISPEGFAISNQGKWIAVSNMGTNFMPIDLPIFGQKASISLLAFDQETGKLEMKDTQEWEGILPEGIAFDAQDSMLVVTSFDYLDLSKRQGGIHFWQIQNDKLLNTQFKISLTRGCHFVKVLK
jgi:DNA-binding beta-propeller fold protein YncE